MPYTNLRFGTLEDSKVPFVCWMDSTLSQDDTTPDRKEKKMKWKGTSNMKSYLTTIGSDVTTTNVLTPLSNSMYQSFHFHMQRATIPSIPVDLNSGWNI